MRSSKTGRKTSNVASAVWHVAPSCWNQMLPANILLFNFCEQKFIQHGPIAIAIVCNGLSLLIFEEKCPNYVSELKSAPNCGPFWVRRLFNVCVQVFFASNASIFFVYVPAKIKMSFIWKDDFFAKISIIYKSICRDISQHCSSVYTTLFVRQKDKTNYLSNQTWANCYHSRNKH